MLKNAADKLSVNWTELETYTTRERAARESERTSLERRIELAHAERNLIVDEAETNLRDFLPKEKAELVVTAAFHGISRTHTEEKHPMTMEMGTTMGTMTMMSPAEEHGMLLAESALRLNEHMRAVSLDLLIRELGVQ